MNSAPYLYIHGEPGNGVLLHEGAGSTMRLNKKRSQRGQNLIEYAIVVTVIASAMLAMSTYVFRAVQATQQDIQEGFTN